MIIIGGGPAGLTAGIYAGRSQSRVLMLERLMPGGQVASTDWIENYPGFEEGIGGIDLMQRMEKQARRFGLEIVSGDVSEADLESNPKRIRAGGTDYEAKTVIIASGTDPRLLNVPGEKEFKGKGVSYCATCDGPFFKDKDVAVIGGGSSGIQESLYLSRFVRSIHLIEIMPHLNAEKILQERAQQDPKFAWYLNHEILAIKGEERVDSVIIKDRSKDEEKTLNVQGVFIWVGLLPNTAFLQGKLQLNEWGYIVTNDQMETSIPGVYAAGDVRENSVRQISTAVGDGTVAAVTALEFIEFNR